MLSTTRPLLAGHNGHHNGDVQQIIHFAHPTTGKTQVVVHAWMDRCDCDCGFDSAHLHHTMTLYYDRFTTILVLVIYHNPGPGDLPQSWSWVLADVFRLYGLERHSLRLGDDRIHMH